MLNQWAYLLNQRDISVIMNTFEDTNIVSYIKLYDLLILIAFIKSHDIIIFENL
jgi:hypothetical protein